MAWAEGGGQREDAAQGGAAGSHRGDEQLQVFGFKGVLVVRIQMFKLLQEGGVVHLLSCTHTSSSYVRGDPPPHSL